MKKISRLGNLLSWALVLAVGLFSCESNSKPQAGVVAAIPLAWSPALRTTTLENGVSHWSNPYPTRSGGLQLGLVVKGGYLAEQPNERGFAHLLEHLAFQRTENFTHTQQRLFFTSMGMTPGADVNAWTGPNYTLFVLRLKSGETKLLDQGLRLLRDWATGILFEEADIRTEREVVFTEMRNHAAPRARLMAERLDRVLHDSAYVGRNGLGSKKTLNSATSERLRRFYQSAYHPANISVLTVGQFDVPVMTQLVKKYFSPIPRSTTASAPVPTVIPFTRGLHVSVLQAKNVGPSTIQILLKLPAVKRTTAIDYRNELIDSLLRQVIHRRLEHFAGSPASPLLKASGRPAAGLPSSIVTLQLVGQVQPGQAEAGATSLLLELKRLELHSLSQLEVDEARSALAELLSEPVQPKAGLTLLRMMASSFVHKVPLQSAKDENSLAKQLLAELKLVEIKQRLQFWLASSERHVLAIPSGAKSFLTEKDLQGLIHRTAQQEPGPFVLTPTLNQLMSEPPARGSIGSEKYYPDIDAHEWKLGNGATVLFKRLKTKAATLQILAVSPGGLATIGDTNIALAMLAPKAIAAAGVGSHSAATTRRLFLRKGIRLNLLLSDYTESLLGQAPVRNLETLLQAIHLTMRQPGLDQLGFEKFRSDFQARQERVARIPAVVLQQAVDRASWENHPWYRPIAPTAALGLKFLPARQLFKRRFGDAGDFIFVLVGDASSSQVKHLVEIYLASIPGTPRQKATPSPLAKMRKGVTTVRVPGGHQDKSTVQLEFLFNNPLSRRDQSVLPLLERLLRERLLQELREAKQGTYAIDTSLEIRTPPRIGFALALSFDCEPSRGTELKSIALQVVFNLAKEPRADFDFAGLVSRHQRLVSYKQKDPDFWLSQLTDSYLRHEPPTALLNDLVPTPPITATELQRMAARLFSEKHYIDAMLDGQTL